MMLILSSFISYNFFWLFTKLYDLDLLKLIFNSVSIVEWQVEGVKGVRLSVLVVQRVKQHLALFDSFHYFIPIFIIWSKFCRYRSIKSRQG